MELFLEGAIGPQRLSQIRIVYEDPNGRRDEGDSIVSKIGAEVSPVTDRVGLVEAGRRDGLAPGGVPDRQRTSSGAP